MIKRILTALALIPLVVLFTAKTEPRYFLGLLMLLSAIGQWEFCRMTGVPASLAVVAIVAGTALLASSGSATALPFRPDVLIGGVLALITARLFLSGAPEGSVRDASAAAMSIMYLPGLFAFQAALREAGVQHVYFLYAAIWASDSLALYSGKYLGRHKLYPSMSPNKTVEGSLGGVAGGVIAALGINHFFGGYSTGAAVALGAIVSTAGQIGDLAESMFKRDAGVKDSGEIFPGHGGVLDRMDAALLGGPALFYFVKAL
ncbi:MAG: phosphatidate cytidylyltransferase [Nitrospirae bacterium]|nr:phosphatidate cytidylyltransferase [Nitrospirota bacterium]